MPRELHGVDLVTSCVHGERARRGGDIIRLIIRIEGSCRSRTPDEDGERPDELSKRQIVRPPTVRPYISW